MHLLSVTERTLILARECQKETDSILEESYLERLLKYHRIRNETRLYDTPFYDSEYYKSTFERQGVVYGFLL
jgi:hypothetical protein